MVLPLLELPEVLQQHFVKQLADVTTAGRLAQANQDCKELLRQRLEALKEARREAKRATILGLFELRCAGQVGHQKVEHYKCNAGATESGQCPCGKILVVCPTEPLRCCRLMSHLEFYHPGRHRELVQQFAQL